MIGNQTLGLPGSRSRGRLLLCNIGRLGDTILSNSILDSAFRTYDRVDYLCGKHNAELVQSDRRMNRVIMLRNSIGGFAAVAKAALRATTDSSALRIATSATNLILAGFFRSRIKTGWNSDRFRPFDRDVRSISAPDTHKVDMMRRIGELAGLKPGEYKPSLVLAPDSITWFRRNYAWDKLLSSSTSPRQTTVVSGRWKMGSVCPGLRFGQKHPSDQCSAEACAHGQATLSDAPGLDCFSAQAIHGRSRGIG